MFLTWSSYVLIILLNSFCKGWPDAWLASNKLEEFISILMALIFFSSKQYWTLPRFDGFGFERKEREDKGSN